jgi:hypothetical protein
VSTAKITVASGWWQVGLRIGERCPSPVRRTRPRRKSTREHELQTFTDPASGRQYTVDPATGQSRWVDPSLPPTPPQTPSPAMPYGQYSNEAPTPKPKTVAGIVGLIVGVLALTISWVPIVNNVAFFFALLSGVLGIVGLIATRPVGKRSARWTAISALVLTALSVVIVLSTQALYGKAIDSVSKGLDTSVPTAPPSADSNTAGGSKPAGTALPKGVTKFGSTVTFKDGSTLTCAAPIAFKRAQYAAGGKEAEAFLKSKCTFTNRSDTVIEPAGTTGRMSAGGVEGESVFQEGLDAPDNPVLPGKSVSWWMGYGVASSDSLQLTVSIGFLSYDAVTFV